MGKPDAHVQELELQSSAHLDTSPDFATLPVLGMLTVIVDDRDPSIQFNGTWLMYGESAEYNM